MSRKQLFPFILFLGLIPFFSKVSAQDINDLSPEVLKKKLSSATSDLSRAEFMLALAKKFLFTYPVRKENTDSCKILFVKTQRIAKGLKDQTLIAKVLLLQAMIENHYNKRDKGLYFANAALKIATKHNDLQQMAESYVLIGQHYGNDGSDLQKKINNYQAAINFFLKAGQKDRAATSLKDLGDFQILQNNNPQAQQSLNQALSIYRITGYDKLQGIYDLIGYNSSKMGDYINGLKYSLLAVRTAERLRDTSAQMGTIYYRAGFAYYMLKQYNPASEYVAKALGIAYKYKDTSAIISMTLNQCYTFLKAGKYKSALPLVNRLKKFNHQVKGEFLEIEFAYLFMSTYLQVKDFKNASLYFEQLKKYSKDGNLQKEIHEKTLRGMIIYYQATGQFKTSYTAIEAHRKFCLKNNFKIFMPPEQLWLFKADSATGNYLSAIKRYQNYKAIDDSVLLEKNSKQTSLLNIQYETDKKDRNLLLKTRNIELLTKQAQFQKINLQQEKTLRKFTIAGIVMLMIILLIGYNRFRIKQRSNKLLKEHQQEINNQNKALQSFNGKQSELLKEKEWLLKEIHHRVKNNLQVTMSLLNIQSSYLSNNQALDAIKDSQRRIHAMSLIHQKLYQSNSLAYINMANYIPELIGFLKESFEHKDHISFELNVEEIELDVSQAVPIGLILNEAITNSMKYAFSQAIEGKIFISLRHADVDQLSLYIKDNGSGLPAGFDKNSVRTLGMNLMSGLSRQIDGDFQLDGSSGTTISIAFCRVNIMEQELDSLKQNDYIEENEFQV